MNNSESSILHTPEEACTGPLTYLYPPSWNSVSGERLNSNALLPNSLADDPMIEVDCSREALVQGTCEISAEVRPHGEIRQPDLGFWLLPGIAIPPGQWECLRTIPNHIVSSSDIARSSWSRLVKRYCDIVASLALLIVLFPLFILVALLIKLDSPGPIFFRHYRVGKNGRNFKLWKFRSMKVEVPEYQVSPQGSGDIRLTRFGRLIRRASIDELPQLLNVLKGEMSLVGPRPEMPFIVARYHKLERQRLAAKPGITGLWQISPARAFPIHENMQYDLHYISNQNFFLDCAIIVRTIMAVIQGIGAI
jgi:lipopolysaccharide/colanic/teichoic acid biosynthesis glycosyltransferase